MEHLKGFTKGIDDTLRGAAGVFGNTFGLFRQAEQEHVPTTKKARNNIEYLDEIQDYPDDDHFVPRYPDLDEPDDYKLYRAPPPASQSFIDVPIDSHQKHADYWKPDVDDEYDDFLVIESTKIETTSPYRYLPFSQSVDMCNRKVLSWLQQIWFLPSDWRASLKLISPKPQYVPFFVFDVTTATSYEATVLIDSKDSSPGKKWIPAEGSFSCTYNEIIACGSCSVNLKLVQKLLNQPGFSYQSQHILPLDPPVYKSATLPDQILPLEITKEDAWENSGRLRVQDWEEQRAREDIKNKHDLLGNNVNDRIRNLRIDTQFINLKHFVILLPVYFTGFEYAVQTYEVLVSGNLGVVVGDRPIGTGAGGKYLLDKLKSVSNLVSETVPLL